MRQSPIAGLGYVVLATPAVEVWRTFATEVLGMMPAKLELPEGSQAFRMDERMARVIVESADEDAVAAVGWDVAGLSEWEDLLSRLGKAGFASEEVSGQAATQRGAVEIRRLVDPSEQVVEFAYLPHHDSIDRFVSPIGVNFVTGDQGMGHVTRTVANYDDTLDFYRNVLGMSLRETIDKSVRAAFLSPNPRQHSMGLTDGRGHNHFRHLMVEVDEIDDVGRALDKVTNGAAPLLVGLGRHFNDLMISFYMESPSGIGIEYGYGGRRVDAGTWVEYSQGGTGGSSLWGHHPVRSTYHPVSK